ncbi:MAG: class I SAM-dependent methyltransferase [Pseudomonadota bacterium]
MHQPASSAHWLSSWWQSPAGERLLAEQSPVLAQAVRRFHGDTLLWLGCHSPTSEIVRRCMVRNRFYSALDGSFPNTDIASFVSDPQALPLPRASVNAVVVHHGLECVRDPRKTMREVSRVLVPGGKLVITGFAPLSTWGVAYALKRPLAELHSRFAHPRPVGTGRLLDWLEVLGFQLDDQRTIWHRRPLPWLRERCRDGWPLGLRSFVLSATKQRNAYVAPKRLAELKARGLAPVAYPKLAAWGRIEQDR